MALGALCPTPSVVALWLGRLRSQSGPMELHTTHHWATTPPHPGPIRTHGPRRHAGPNANRGHYAQEVLPHKLPLLAAQQMLRSEDQERSHSAPGSGNRMGDQGDLHRFRMICERVGMDLVRRIGREVCFFVSHYMYAHRVTL